MAQLILEIYNSNNETLTLTVEDCQEFIDVLVDLDEQKTSNLLVTESEAETEEDAELEADALHFLGESILGYLDYQLEEGLIGEVAYFKTRAYLESQDIIAYDISITEDGYDLDEDDEDLIAEVEAELENEITGTNVSISESISDLIGELSLVQEVVYHRVIRHGILKKLLMCPSGYKRVDNRCIKMASSEVRRRMKASLKANKTKRREFKNSMFRNLLMKKRNKSLRIRHQKNLK